MAEQQPVVVEPPRGDGGRRVRLGHEILGLAYTRADVEEFCRRTGLEDVDAVTSPLIRWHGGGPDVWSPPEG